METSPLGIRRQQTRPLPVVGTPDDVVTGPVAVPADAATAPQPTAPGATVLGARPPRLTVTRVAAARSRELSGEWRWRLRGGRRAGGAGDGGLAGLRVVAALQEAGDSMTAVSLAGTRLLAAGALAQRGN